MPERMDVIGRLNVFRSVCEREWKTPAEVKQTKSNGVPFLQVGTKVHIVIFPGKHFVRLYFNMPYAQDQTALTYDMDRTEGGKWMSDLFIMQVTLFAAAINFHLEGQS